MAKIRKSFTHGRAKQAVTEAMANRKRGLKPTTSPTQKRMTPEEQQAFLDAFKQRQAETDAYLNSPEVIEYCRKADEKEKRKEGRRASWRRVRASDRSPLRVSRNAPACR